MGTRNVFRYEPDPELARAFREAGFRAPLEAIVETDWMATALRREKKGGLGRVVRLACLHTTVVHGQRRNVRCPSCQKMIDDGGDYERFRNSGRRPGTDTKEEDE